MGEVVHVDFRARARRVAQHPHARTCERCPDPATEGPFCGFHAMRLAVELADHRERMARKAEGEWFDVVVEGVDEQEAGHG